MPKFEDWDHDWPLEKKLAAMADLEENWDSYGGLPTTPLVINLVRKILQDKDTSKDYKIYPLNDGGVYIIWKSDNYTTLDVEIEENGEMFVSVHLPDKKLLYFNIPVSK